MKWRKIFPKPKLTHMKTKKETRTANTKTHSEQCFTDRRLHRLLWLLWAGSSGSGASAAIAAKPEKESTPPHNQPRRNTTTTNFILDLRMFQLRIIGFDPFTFSIEESYVQGLQTHSQG
jgi:hypothetical protein